MTSLENAPKTWHDQSIMTCNIAKWDRALRLLIGIFLVAWAVAGGPWWAYFGLYLLATAAWRFCPAYAFSRFRTEKAN